MKPSPLLVARLVRELRRRVKPVSGHVLAVRFNTFRLRTWGECASAARHLGVSYVVGKGYVIAKTRAERLEGADRLDRMAAELHRAARRLRCGHVPQARIPATRIRRALGAGGGTTR